jgi:hypothetical protein
VCTAMIPIAIGVVLWEIIVGSEAEDDRPFYAFRLRTFLAAAALGAVGFTYFVALDHFFPDVRTLHMSRLF